MKGFKPMLSGRAPADLSKLRYPVLASPKLDGIRALTLPPEIFDTKRCRLVSRSLKPIPNTYVREWAEANLPPGLDGELLLADMTAPFQEVTSAIMAHDGQPDFRYAVFDHIDVNGEVSFQDRLELARSRIGDLQQRGYLDVLPVRHDRVLGPAELSVVCEQHVEQGYEGTMIRDPEGLYKFGRSTTREGGLLKIKHFVDEDATVTGVVELMHNQNDAKKDNLGHAKRSTAKAGLVPAGKLGALKCRFDDGTEFEVGTGFTDAQRVRIWGTQGTAVGKRVKIKHQPPPGGRRERQAPRFPVFLGFRHEDD